MQQHKLITYTIKLKVRTSDGIGVLCCRCAGSSGAVHNVVLIDVYLDLENPGGPGFWGGGIDGLLGEQKGSVYKHQGAEVDGS
jgi:hypothetical protein